MTFNQLMNMGMDQITRPVRAWILDRRIDAEYRNMAFFKWQVRNGNRGSADSAKRIVNLETQRRNL
jgi:hypothetical protein